MKSDINKAQNKKQMGRPIKDVDEKYSLISAKLDVLRKKSEALLEYLQELYKEDLPIY